MTGPSGDALQVFYGTIPLVGAALLAQWNNNKRLEELSKRLDDMNRRIDDGKTSLNKRIDDLAGVVIAGFAQVNARLAKLEDRVGDLERRSPLVRS